MPVVQEKNQVVAPVKNPEGENAGWISCRESRAKKGLPGRELGLGRKMAEKAASNGAFFNTLPPGMDIEDQEVVDIRRMGMSIAGNMPTGPATGDVTNHEVNARSLREGFDKKALSPVDEEYTEAHEDAFYDDLGGFVERNNYLDRL